MKVVCCPTDCHRHASHEKYIEEISRSGGCGVKGPFRICKERECDSNTEGSKVSPRLLGTTGQERTKNCPMDGCINHSDRGIPCKQPKHFCARKMKVPDPRITVGI